ncbi:MAG: hypothetical protein ABFS17_11695 [Chloroflexota bacterium]
MPKKLNLPIISILITILLLALGLAWVSSDFSDLAGFLPFSYVLIFGTLIIWSGWRLIQPQAPKKWLLYLVMAAALLRLAAGVIWFVELPIFGHPNDTQQSGYIMYDAYRRDTAAWELSQSDQPLISAFQGADHMDQYGGLLFISGAIYRFLSNGTHYPLIIAVITSAFSATAVFFTWSLSKQLWGNQAAKIAAWTVTLYPEAVLLGSSQMREAFTITLVTAFSAFIIHYWKKRELKYLAFALISILVCSLITWPIALMMVFIGVVITITLYPWKAFNKKRITLILGVIGVLVILMVVIGFKTLNWWNLVIDYQTIMTVDGSGKLDAVLSRIPEWLHFPYLVGYGIVRPLLPSALVAYTSGWLWHAIAIWRALGWTFLFGMFLYANLLAFKEKSWRSIVGTLLLIVWVGIIFAAVRGGGDLWDNPRYRVVVAGLQSCLAAWALFRQQESKDPWLRRVIVTVGMLIAWFLAWYIDRKVFGFGWPITNMATLIALALTGSILYILWDIKRLSHQKSK